MQPSHPSSQKQKTPSQTPSLTRLKRKLSEIENLKRAAEVLAWDQRVCMPSRGAEARASQQATLAKISHELFVSPETQDLLNQAEAETAKTETDPSDQAILRVCRRSLDKSIRVPTPLLLESTEVFSLAQTAWESALKKGDFSEFQPWLEKVILLRRSYAEAVGYKESLYDALLDDFEEGATVSEIDPCFEKLKSELIPFFSLIREKVNFISNDILRKDYELSGQDTFCRTVLKACGYDFNRGRLDLATHPFSISFSKDDVRITTRYSQNWLPAGIFGSLHEMGHAFYEMNLDPKYEDTPLAGGVSLGIHESQSRLWENLVGRSKAFWTFWYPKLQAQFPSQLQSTSLEEFYKAINRVSASMIRVEADEVTYNLHVILRYELEKELLEGNLKVCDAPAAWNEKMKTYLGIMPSTDKEGILQDVHWSGGALGYFPTYTLGNILASQFYSSALSASPNIPEQISSGNYTGLSEWLKQNIHQYGKRFTPRDLIKKSTGEALNITPYIQYLKNKFGEIYQL